MGRKEPGTYWCHPHPHHLLALPRAQGHPYLCATLPFLMSEMVRGSPRFLLAAGKREVMTLTYDDLSLGGGKDWGMGAKPHALLPLVWLGGSEQITLPLCASVSPLQNEYNATDLIEMS